MKRTLREALYCCVLVLLSAALGLGLLTAVYALPTEAAVHNAERSVDIFLEEGLYPSILPWTQSTLDNWTDSIILRTAAFDRKPTALEKALNSYYVKVSKPGVDMTPVEEFVALYSNEEGLNLSRWRYPRYWHGYVILVKPLMSFFSYGEIRILNGIAQTLLTGLVLYLLWSRGYRRALLPYALMWGCLCPPALACSLQYSDVFYILSAGVIVLLCRYEQLQKRGWIPYLFLLLGVATAFFDFLTYPLATLGVPLAIRFLLKEPEELRKELPQLILLCAVWGFGYLGMWGMKWVIASVFTSVNVLENAWKQLVSRIGRTVGENSISFLGVVRNNLQGIFRNPATILAAVFGLGCIARALVKKQLTLRSFLCFGLIACLPLGWYFVAGNHSYIHWMYTHKALCISVLAWTLMANSMRRVEAPPKEILTT